MTSRKPSHPVRLSSRRAAVHRRRPLSEITMRPARFIVPASQDASPSVSRRSPSWHISTTVGRFVFIMRWRYPFTKRFELAGHLWPGVALDYERPPGLAEFGSSPCIVQEVDHRCSEILGIVRCYEFFLVIQREPFGAHRRR